MIYLNSYEYLQNVLKTPYIKKTSVRFSKNTLKQISHYERSKKVFSTLEEYEKADVIKNKIRLLRIKIKKL